MAPLWGDVRIPIIMVSGPVNSGKTLFGLTCDLNCRRPASEVKPTTLVYDQEGSADSYVGALNFDHRDTRAAVAAGVHREVVSAEASDPNWLKILKEKADVNDSPSASMFRAWYLSLIKVPAKQYAVGVVDTFTPLQEGLIAWLRAHPQAFGRSFAEYNKASSMFLWPDVKTMLAHILAVDCRLRFETFVLTVHLKNEWAGGRATGRKIAEGLDTLEKLATLHLELDRSPTAKGKDAPRVPYAILKKERLVAFGATSDDDMPILPPRLPKATPDAIREYILAPPDFAKLATGERMPDSTLNDDQKLLIQQEMSRNAVEVETAKLSAIEMAQQNAAKQAQQVKPQPTPPPADDAPEMATIDQQREIVGLIKSNFPSGGVAKEWLQNQFGGAVDHPCRLSASLAIEALGKLRTMEVAKPKEQPPEPPVEDAEPANDGPITQAQRDKIRDITLSMYGNESGRDIQDQWLKTMGYSSAMSCTSAQADARIVELTEAATVSAGVDSIPF